MPARVAKLADAGGLNPPSTNVEYGFESRPGHHVAGILPTLTQLRYQPLLTRRRPLSSYTNALYVCADL